MKVAFSYKNQSFLPLLAGSVLLHAVVFGASGLVSTRPAYGVVQAPSSVEVYLVKQQASEVQAAIRSDRIFTAKESPEDAVQARDERKDTVKEEMHQELLPDAAAESHEKGAVVEAMPQYYQNAAPVYPEQARRRGWQGTVHLRVLVNQKGNAEKVEVKMSSGRRILDDSAVKAVRKWVFTPAHAGDLRFASWIEIPVQFVLKEVR